MSCRCELDTSSECRTAKAIHTDYFIKKLNMKETVAVEMKEAAAHIRCLMKEIEQAAKTANDANSNVMQLAWDLGDCVQQARIKSPDTYSAMLDGLGVSKETERAWLKVRAAAETKDDLKNANCTRQAMLALLVPGKEQTEERIELVPPQTFYLWVNKCNSWMKKVDVGLAKYDRDQFLSATTPLYEFLKKQHEG